jgi:hypothetical protein
MSGVASYATCGREKKKSGLGRIDTRARASVVAQKGRRMMLRKQTIASKATIVRRAKPRTRGWELAVLVAQGTKVGGTKVGLAWEGGDRYAQTGQEGGGCCSHVAKPVLPRFPMSAMGKPALSFSPDVDVRAQWDIRVPGWALLGGRGRHRETEKERHIRETLHEPCSISFGRRPSAERASRSALRPFPAVPSSSSRRKCP